MMYIEDKDLNNPELTMLPIRKGCSGGPCACSGYCREIVGDIERTKYEAFLKMYVSYDDFFNRNKVPHVSIPGKKILKDVTVHWPTEGANKYKLMMALKNRLQVDNATYLNQLMKKREFARNTWEIANWDVIKPILDECGVKYTVYYEQE